MARRFATDEAELAQDVQHPVRGERDDGFVGKKKKGFTLEKLREERASRHYDGRSMREAIDVLERQIDDDLERVRRLHLMLKIFQRWGEAHVAHLHFGEKPRLAIANDEEIDLAFLFVSQVVELESTEAEIRPAMDRFEQLARDERFGARARSVYDGPVRNEPFRFLSERLGNVREPRPNAKPEVETLERLDPTPYGLDCDAELACQIAVHDLLA
jgi:hypothetical protein